MKRYNKDKRISISNGFLIMLAALIYLDGQGVVLFSVLAAILHEAGHWFVIRLVGGKVCALRLTTVGAEMELDPGCAVMSYGREFAVSLAGPVINLLAVWFSVLVEWYVFAGINLCLGLLNLLPVYPLDGGRILSCVLERCCPKWADTISLVITIVFTGMILGLGWAAWRGWRNITLFCAALWLLDGVLKT